MAAPEDNAGYAGGKLGGHGVGIAMIAIFAGMALVVALAASDGAIFGQNFQSSPSQDLPVSESGAGGGVVLSRDAFDEGSGEESSSAAPPPEDGAMLSEEERRLLAMKDFPWDSIAGGQIASSQDAFQRFGQQSVAQQRPVEPGTESLSISDEVAVDVDRRDRGDRDDSDRDTFLAGIIEIDIPIGDDEEEQEDVEERPDDDDTTEIDQDEELQDGETENDQEGSDDGTDGDSSDGDSGEDNSGSGSDEQSGEAGDSGGSNSTDTSGPSEDSGGESDTADGNSTGTEASISLG